MAKLSASSLNLFLRCPYAYYLKEIEKVPPSFTDKVFVGKLVHKTLENYFNHKKQEQDTNASLIDFLDDSYKELTSSSEISITKALNYKDESVDYLKQYESIAKTLAPLEVEKEIQLEIAGVNITGYIDLLTVDRKLIDFKTTTQKTIKLSSEYKMQLSIYSLVNIANSYYLHYITSSSFKEFKIKPLKHSFIYEIIETFNNAYLSGAFTPSGLTHPYACQYCAYKEQCKFYKDFSKEI